MPQITYEDEINTNETKYFMSTIYRFIGDSPRTNARRGTIQQLLIDRVMLRQCYVLTVPLAGRRG